MASIGLRPNVEGINGFRNLRSGAPPRNRKSEPPTKYGRY